ncbi:hypothetical protein MJO28_007227 [Puccinia striiformis f. sp. tritici]|uniref:DNA 3'-5' helicase n=2 Tax=Puccinia striiformis TaxID=27350 RepID=A0A2S4W864_9BASI|nr:hypothetical protein MJO28_007227 [Puccinia striiformis f. sp. tritici]POW17949.1 hypothetical protein PSTT_00172 [Puccinia striiformis]
MATNNVPVLLLSATCRPEAVDAITTSLMLHPSGLHMIDGELTHPEIRFIRIYMDSTLTSCNDLLRLFAPHTHTPANQAVPMIIYSGTCNRTFQVMKVVNKAQNTKKHKYNPCDGFIRRYHTVTGEEEKERTIEDFRNTKVPVISATMALGLRQNLKRVRCVVHMGRGDPGVIVQMDDDDWMDACAVSECCIRIATALDSKVGYIPLTEDDPNMRAKRAHEESQGFAKCKCSTCEPEAAKVLIERIKQMNQSNFDPLLKNPIEQAQAVVDLFNQIYAREDHDTIMLKKAIGGQCFDGQIEALNVAIRDWKEGEYYCQHLRRQVEIDDFIEAEGVRMREAMELKLAGLKAQAALRQLSERQAKMDAKAAEKQGQNTERQAQRLRGAKDRAMEKRLIAAERAAERTWIAKEKKATKALEKQQCTPAVAASSQQI